MSADLDSTARALGKTVAAATTEILENAGVSSPSDAALAAGFAAEALANVERVLSDSFERLPGLDDDALRDLKRVRKMLRRAARPRGDDAVAGAAAADDRQARPQPKAEESSRRQPDTETPDLGQYKTAAAGMSTKMASKFARLMGGGKAGAAEEVHDTYAATAAEEEARQRAIQAQFDAAMSHKGKRGLGK